jgi:CYTH domain-containing protein
MEIERKFLVNNSLWTQLNKPTPKRIKQAYLSDDSNCTVRVRTKGPKGFLTIKGKSVGISRSEYEYQIPLEEAEKMIAEFCPKVLSKDRYEIQVGEHLWEVDVFHGKLAPLIVAEIELRREDESFDLPVWVWKEVSDDVEYYNSRLILKL